MRAKAHTHSNDINTAGLLSARVPPDLSDVHECACLVADLPAGKLPECPVEGHAGGDRLQRRGRWATSVYKEEEGQ